MSLTDVLIYELYHPDDDSEMLFSLELAQARASDAFKTALQEENYENNRVITELDDEDRELAEKCGKICREAFGDIIQDVFLFNFDCEGDMSLFFSDLMGILLYHFPDDSEFWNQIYAKRHVQELMGKVDSKVFWARTRQVAERQLPLMERRAEIEKETLERRRKKAMKYAPFSEEWKTRVMDLIDYRGDDVMEQIENKCNFHIDAVVKACRYAIEVLDKAEKEGTLPETREERTAREKQDETERKQMEFDKSVSEFKRQQYIEKTQEEREFYLNYKRYHGDAGKELLQWLAVIGGGILFLLALGKFYMMITE